MGSMRDFVSQFTAPVRTFADGAVERGMKALVEGSAAVNRAIEERRDRLAREQAEDRASSKVRRAELEAERQRLLEPFYRAEREDDRVSDALGHVAPPSEPWPPFAPLQVGATRGDGQGGRRR
jgi:hypothetical protein